MEYNPSCIKGYCGETKNICYLVYFYNGGDTLVPVCCFNEKEKAIKYCKKNSWINFEYTEIIEIPFNDSDYEF